jgi:hypothetical protein
VLVARKGGAVVACVAVGSATHARHLMGLVGAMYAVGGASPAVLAALADYGLGCTGVEDLLIHWKWSEHVLLLEDGEMSWDGDTCCWRDDL